LSFIVSDSTPGRATLGPGLTGLVKPAGIDEEVFVVIKTTAHIIVVGACVPN